MENSPATILDLLSTAATTNAGITTYPPNGAPSKGVRTSYADFKARADRNALLVHHIPGISPGTVVLLHFHRHSDNFEWFWAVTKAGYLPAMSTPLVNDPDHRKKHLAHLHSVLENPIVLTSEALVSEFFDVGELRMRTIESLSLGKGHVNDVDHGVSRGSTKGHINGTTKAVPEGRTNGDVSKIGSKDASPRQDIAILMLTSGSTGNAKAVCLHHDQIIQSAKGKSLKLGLAHDDVFLNWIGMDHVAGLIESHIHAMYLCAEQVHVQASDLLVDPLTFLRLIDQHRVSYTFAPNFFLASLKRALLGVNDTTALSLDLSCLKTLMCGGEANVVKTLTALTEELHRFGARDEFLRPGFGMTETCAAAMYGGNCPSYELERGLEFSPVGTCIPGIMMRIIKENDEQGGAKTGEIGHLQVIGPIVFREYYNNPKATKDSFTHDGWFRTGDKAYIDDQGNLNLAGRSKETIVINGVKYSSHELETAIEESLVAGVTPSYTAVFPHRPKDSQTEELCIVYLPTYDSEDARTRTETADSISHVSMMVASVKPYRIIPLTAKLLSKSSLGKLSRAKIQNAFETGEYHELEEKNNNAIKSYRVSQQETPTTETEETISSVFCRMFDLAPNMVWVGSSLFDYGVTSIELIAFQQRVQDRLAMGVAIPVFTIMSNPTIRGLAEALNDLLKGSRSYNPVVQLHSHGTQTPLWLIHPGTGEILIYVSLVKFITDRPLYALRARGFEKDEEYFHSVSEAIDIYHSHIKKIQPAGPYAILGYSQGSILAFEVAKSLEADGDKVAFCSGLDTPPHVSAILGEPDWLHLLLHVSYLLELTTREHAFEIENTLRQGTHEEALTYMLELAPRTRREELDLDIPKLAKWVDMVSSLVNIIKDYEPSGNVEKMDVFYAENSILMPQETWLEDRLKKWGEFTRGSVRMHECEGTHNTLLTAAHIFSFQTTLKAVLSERGI